MKTDMSIFDACMIVDGVEGETSLLRLLEAYALLVRTGLAWTLQGRIGRQAAEFIKAGLISPAGEIDYDEAEAAGYSDDTPAWDDSEDDWDYIEIGDDGEPVAYFLED